MRKFQESAVGYLDDLCMDGEFVESISISGPMDALLNDQADICMISAFAGVLPAIDQGKDVHLAGAAMLATALAVYETIGVKLHTTLPSPAKSSSALSL